VKLAHFMDFTFDTEDSTFYPRFETELLVERSIEVLRLRENSEKGTRVLDIGTGSGNVAISLTNYLPLSRIVALDISDTALRVAERNAKKYGTSERIEFIKSDLFDILHKRQDEFRGSFDLVVSNPPYISREDIRNIPYLVKDDPYLALYGGGDGLKLIRRIIKEAPYFLKEKGTILMEIGYDQSESVKELLKKSENFKNINIFKDYSGIDRIIKAEKS